MSDVTARMTPALGDRYAIERELGSGGMATVYLAEDLKHHRKVAVKANRGWGRGGRVCANCANKERREYSSFPIGGGITGRPRGVG